MATVRKTERLFEEPLQAGVALNDVQITALVEAGSLITQPTFEPRGLDSISYDVRIGSKGLVGGQGKILDLSKEPVPLDPGAYGAVISAECMQLPDNVFARINTKRSFSYEGVALLTGTQIDPGYKGHLLFGFYNASSRKVILQINRPICSLLFETLGAKVGRPKPPDPDLLHGNFPDAFVNRMANLEVLSLGQISEHVKQIDRITSDILELRDKYQKVWEPIESLTADVKLVNETVRSVQEVARQNGKQIGDLIAQMSLLVDKAELAREEREKIGTTLEGVRRKSDRFYVLVYLFWAFILLVIGGVLTKVVYPALFESAPS